MKLLISTAFFLTTSTTIQPLLRCVCLAQTKHHQLKDTQNSSFLDLDINAPKHMTIHLANCSTHSDRFIKRLVPAKEFKKNGQWCLEISSDPQKCLELVNHPISTEKETGDIIYQWQFSPQKSGLALVRATYNSRSRTAPLIQEFLVTIE